MSNTKSKMLNGYEIPYFKICGLIRNTNSETKISIFDEGQQMREGFNSGIYNVAIFVNKKLTVTFILREFSYENKIVIVQIDFKGKKISANTEECKQLMEKYIPMIREMCLNPNKFK